MNLQLSLKKQWFEMTKSGIKTEDYREVNEYWGKRLISGLNEKWELTEALSELRLGRCIKKVEQDYNACFHLLAPNCSIKFQKELLCFYINIIKNQISY